MFKEPLRVALDLSCALERPLTGVGYAAWHQAHALANLDAPLDLRLFATRARGVRIPEGVRRGFTRCFATPCARRLK
ncbi:MAG: hypothetical protein R6V12_07205, partial [Candidatus Hydrogenedentota bacterium]